MPRIKITGAELETRERGAGQPIVFVHGAMGDECAAVVKERVLADHYRVIDYHRRGWGDSSRAEDVVSISQQAEDCRAVIEHIGVQPAHFVGQSYGGAILLQLALDAPEVVQSLALQEPPLPSVLLNSPAFGAVAEKAGAVYGSGDKAGAIEAFATEMGGDDFRAVFDRTMPPGYFERWVEAADTLFQSEIPSLQEWTFTREDASRITQPVLNMVGANTRAYFREIHDTIRTWLPHAENVELPDATHAAFQTNPIGSAERIAAFISRHQIEGY
jgi:pimeloyl-ACP methyl ester carboxylesterase